MNASLIYESPGEITLKYWVHSIVSGGETQRKLVQRKVSFASFMHIEVGDPIFQVEYESQPSESLCIFCEKEIAVTTPYNVN